MTSRLAPAGLLLLGVLAISDGCSAPMSETEVADAEASFTEAEAAFEARQYPQALEGYNKAIAAGGLQSDHYGRLFIHRAVCLVEAGEIEAAMADLDLAAEGSPDLDEVFAARGYACLKRGDQPAADRWFEQAQRLNPQLTLPTVDGWR